jgi:predicted HTH transcriptional regulator
MTCLLLSAFQDSYFKKRRETEESQEVLEDKPQPVKANISQTSPLVAQPKLTPIPMDTGSNDLTQKLLDYVRKNGHAKTGALIEVLGSPRRSVIRMLNKLIADGRLVREGNGPGAVYKINDSQKQG